MFWCAISETETIGLYDSEVETITGQKYKMMLHYFMFLKLANYPCNMIFLQDGAHLHYENIARQYLDHKLLERCMWRGGPFSWPLQSSDLTPGDFFL